MLALIEWPLESANEEEGTSLRKKVAGHGAGGSLGQGPLPREWAVG